MFTDIINRQAFEFTCKAEETAKRIQHEIEAHTTIQINQIISSIFSRAMPGNDYLKIDKLEIDLGDITVNNFGNGEMLARLRQILEQKITGMQNYRYPADAEKKSDGIRVSSQIDNELEVIQTFIMRGDVPWWFDKNNPLNVDSIVRKIIDLNSRPLLQFIEEHMANPDVMARLFANLQPATISRIEELIPGFSRPLLQQRFFDENIHVEINSLHPAQLKKLSSIFNKKEQPSIDKIKLMLVNRLVQLRRLVQMKKISVRGTVLERLLLKRNALQLLALISSSKKTGRAKERKEKKEIAALINRLSVFQAELLFFELSSYPVSGSIFFDNGSNDSAGDLFEKSEPLLRQVQPGSHGNFTERSDSDSNNAEDDILWQKAPGDGQVSFSGENHDDLKAGDSAVNTNMEDEPDNGFGEIGKQELPTSDALNITDEITTGVQETTTAGNDSIDHRTDKVQLPDFSSLNESQGPQTKKEDQKSRKMIAFIMKRLHTSDVVLLRYLQQLKYEHLEHMSEIFKRRDRENTERKEMVAALLEHPNLTKHNVLQVFANLEFTKEQKTGHVFDHSAKKKPEKKSIAGSIAAKLTSLQATFTAIIRQLPPNEFITIKDIFQKGSFDTKAEMKLVKKTLLKLQHKHIMLLKFFTELPPGEIEKLLTSAKEITFQNKKLGGNEINSESDPFYIDAEQRKIYVENAGLCLLAIFLPGLFKKLGYLENGIFRNKGFAIRAIYALQYIASGKNKSPEYVLQFNKLLCGLRVDDYITKSVRLTKKEMFEADDYVLKAVIGNWAVLKNTSLNGFRGSFFKRKGILIESGSKWTLQVERKGYDILLNSIPWSYGIIKSPWMNKLINVEW